MRVKELIKQLRQHPPNNYVVVCRDEDRCDDITKLILEDTHLYVEETFWDGQLFIFVINENIINNRQKLSK